MPCRCKEKAKRMVKGAIGITKAALGVDPASADLIVQRLTICRTCKHYKGQRSVNRNTERCGLCGCLLRPKARINSETCPDGKW